MGDTGKQLENAIRDIVRAELGKGQKQEKARPHPRQIAAISLFALDCALFLMLLPELLKIPFVALFLKILWIVGGAALLVTLDHVREAGLSLADRAWVAPVMAGLALLLVIPQLPIYGVPLLELQGVEVKRSDGSQVEPAGVGDAPFARVGRLAPESLYVRQAEDDNATMAAVEIRRRDLLMGTLEAYLPMPEGLVPRGIGPLYTVRVSRDSVIPGARIGFSGNLPAWFRRTELRRVYTVTRTGGGDLYWKPFGDDNSNDLTLPAGSYTLYVSTCRDTFSVQRTLGRQQHEDVKLPEDFPRRGCG